MLIHGENTFTFTHTHSLLVACAAVSLASSQCLLGNLSYSLCLCSVVLRRRMKRRHSDESRPALLTHFCFTLKPVDTSRCRQSGSEEVRRVEWRKKTKLKTDRLCLVFSDTAPANYQALWSSLNVFEIHWMQIIELEMC